MKVIASIGRHLAGNVVGYLALLVATTGSAYAVATIGSAEVEDNSLKSADIRDDGARGGGLSAKDLRPRAVGTSEVADGSLTRQDLAPSVVGLADHVARWDVAYTGTGDDIAVVRSTDTFEPGTLVQALDGRVTGDFSSCTGLSHVRVSLEDRQLALLEFSPGSSGEARPFRVDAAGEVTQSARGLMVIAECRTADPTTGAWTQLPVPSFELAVSFQWRDLRSVPPTTQFE